MRQITIRASDELIDRVKAAARSHGESMNEWVVFVLDAATDPAHVGDRAEQLRERLRRAGLLLEPVARTSPRPAPALVEAAGRRAARGKPVSDYVVEDRDR
jgi:uncharacterized protein (DUF1778 family)